MKYKAHIPVEQYGFIEAEWEDDGNPAEIYHEIKHSTGFGDGLAEDDFREIYDLVASKKAINGDPGMLDGMNACQRFAINECKKFNKRTM